MIDSFSTVLTKSSRDIFTANMRTGSEFSEAGRSREGTSAALGPQFAINEQRVVDLIRSQGPISRTDISKITGISAATSGRIAGRFLAEGIFIEPRKHATGIGRPSVLLEVNPERASVLAIDLSRTEGSIALADMAGEITWTRTITDSEDYAALLAVVNAATQQALETRAPIAVGTIGLPAIPHDQDDVTAASSGSSWHGNELLSKLGNDTSIPFMADNDVNLSAVGHRWCGAATGLDNFAVVHLGTGVGGAIFSDGRLVRGQHNSASEFGCLPTDRSSSALSMQQALSMRGLTVRATEELATSDKPSALRELNAFSALDVVEAALTQDPVATDVLTEAIDRLTHVVIAISCIAGPAVVIIDGELGQALEPFLDPLRSSLDNHVVGDISVVSGTGCTQGTLHGAIASGLEQAWHHEFPARSAN